MIMLIILSSEGIEALSYKKIFDIFKRPEELNEGNVVI